jgi:hypothetical protein
MPTKGHEGHDAGKPEGVVAHAAPKHDSEHPGYETQDVNIGGVVTFVAGLCGFIVIFFFFCFFMGKSINYWLEKDDGPKDKWHASNGTMGQTPRGGKRDDLTSNATTEQIQLNEMAAKFPGPRLQTDDGNQDTADLHAKEDLLLDNYSKGGELADGSIRIPVSRAMELIVERGLPKPAGAAAEHKTLMAGEQKIDVQAPLTNGFARTGYELDTIQARKQRMEAAEVEK